MKKVVLCFLMMLFLQNTASAGVGKDLLKDIFQEISNQSRMPKGYDCSAKDAIIITDQTFANYKYEDNYAGYRYGEFYELKAISETYTEWNGMRAQDYTTGRMIEYNTSPHYESGSSLITGPYREERFYKKCVGVYVEYSYIKDTLIPKENYVYAIGDNECVTKYKTVVPSIKYEPVSYFKQTQKMVIPTQLKYNYDKNGKLLSQPKQTIFSEITQYDMNGKVIAIFQRRPMKYVETKDFGIYEYNPDRTLKKRHYTEFIPYLQWEEDYNKSKLPDIFRTIKDGKWSDEADYQKAFH